MSRTKLTMHFVKCPNCDISFRKDLDLNAHLLFSHGIVREFCKNYNAIDESSKRDMKKSRLETLKRKIFSHYDETEILDHEAILKKVDYLDDREKFDYLQLCFELGYRPQYSIKFFNLSMCIPESVYKRLRYRRIKKKLLFYGAVFESWLSDQIYFKCSECDQQVSSEDIDELNNKAMKHIQTHPILFSMEDQFD